MPGIAQWCVFYIHALFSLFCLSNRTHMKGSKMKLDHLYGSLICLRTLTTLLRVAKTKYTPRQLINYRTSVLKTKHFIKAAFRVRTRRLHLVFDPSASECSTQAWGQAWDPRLALLPATFRPWDVLPARKCQVSIGPPEGGKIGMQVYCTYLKHTMLAASQKISFSDHVRWSATSIVSEECRGSITPVRTRVPLKRIKALNKRKPQQWNDRNSCHCRVQRGAARRATSPASVFVQDLIAGCQAV